MDPERRDPGRPVEVVVLIGLPASGKSTYYRDHFASTHAHVSKDLMPNIRQRDRVQNEMIERALGEGRPVVVDNTNATRRSRAPLIEVAHRHSAPAIAIYFDAKPKKCVERNRQRSGRARVPDVAVYTTSKKLEAPTTAEGFDEIRYVKVD